MVTRCEGVRLDFADRRRSPLLPSPPFFLFVRDGQTVTTRKARRPDFNGLAYQLPPLPPFYSQGPGYPPFRLLPRPNRTCASHSLIADIEQQIPGVGIVALLEHWAVSGGPARALVSWLGTCCPRRFHLLWFFFFLLSFTTRRHPTLRGGKWSEHDTEGCSTHLHTLLPTSKNYTHLVYSYPGPPQPLRDRG